MAIYLGTYKSKLKFGSKPFKLASNFRLNGIALLTFDRYYLKDSNGLYITLKEAE